MVAKPADLIEKDPGLLWRLIITGVSIGLAGVVSLYCLYLLIFSSTFSKTTIFAVDGTESKGEFPWFAWAGPILLLAAMGLVVLCCIGYFFKVLWPQLKGR